MLENITVTLTQAFDQARPLDLAQQNSERYVQSQIIPNPQTAYVEPMHSEPTPETKDLTMAAVKKKCAYCRNDYRPRYRCPARNVTCHKCSKKGHFQKVCMSPANPYSAAVYTSSLGAITAGAPNELRHTTIEILISGKKIQGLIDSGSSESHLRHDLVLREKLPFDPKHYTVLMTCETYSTEIIGVTSRYHHER